MFAPKDETHDGDTAMNGLSLLFLWTAMFAQVGLPSSNNISAEGDGKNFGWQINKYNELEYLIQISPNALREMQSMHLDKIESSIPKELVGRIKRVVVITGTQTLPRAPLSEVERIVPTVASLPPAKVQDLEGGKVVQVNNPASDNGFQSYNQTQPLGNSLGAPPPQGSSFLDSARGGVAANSGGSLYDRYAQPGQGISSGGRLSSTANNSVGGRNGGLGATTAWQNSNLNAANGSYAGNGGLSGGNYNSVPGSPSSGYGTNNSFSNSGSFANNNTNLSGYANSGYAANNALGTGSGYGVNNGLGAGSGLGANNGFGVGGASGYAANGQGSNYSYDRFADNRFAAGNGNNWADTNSLASAGGYHNNSASQPGYNQSTYANGLSGGSYGLGTQGGFRNDSWPNQSSGIANGRLNNSDPYYQTYGGRPTSGFGDSYPQYGTSLLDNRRATQDPYLSPATGYLASNSAIGTRAELPSTQPNNFTSAGAVRTAVPYLPQTDNNYFFYVFFILSVAVNLWLVHLLRSLYLRYRGLLGSLRSQTSSLT